MRVQEGQIGLRRLGARAGAGAGLVDTAINPERSRLWPQEQDSGQVRGPEAGGHPRADSALLSVPSAKAKMKMKRSRQGLACEAGASHCFTGLYPSLGEGCLVREG